MRAASSFEQTLTPYYVFCTFMYILIFNLLLLYGSCCCITPGRPLARFVGKWFHPQKKWNIPFDSWRWADLRKMIFIKIVRWPFSKIAFLYKVDIFFLNGPLLGFLKRRACFVGLCWRSNAVRTTSVKEICANVRRRVQKPAISYRNATQRHDGPKFNTRKREITLIDSHTAWPGLTVRLHRRAGAGRDTRCASFRRTVGRALKSYAYNFQDRKK